MYESPIELFKTEPIVEQIQSQFDDMVYRGVVRAGVTVDKDELIRALQYDRQQYEKGYADGRDKSKQWFFVDDLLPDSGEPVLAYYERNAWPDGSDTAVRKKEIGIGWHVDGMWHVDGCNKVVGIAWMPLPYPPYVNQTVREGEE